MKIKNIKIGIKSLEDNLNEFAAVWKKLENEEKVDKHEALYFESIDALRSVLTNKRIEILRTIKKQKPGSIYELAKILNRDLKNVSEDVKLLAELGFVTLEKVKTDRKRTVPTVDYGEITMEIGI